MMSRFGIFQFLSSLLRNSLLVLICIETAPNRRVSREANAGGSKTITHEQLAT